MVGCGTGERDAEELGWLPWVPAGKDGSWIADGGDSSFHKDWQEHSRPSGLDDGTRVATAR